MKKLKLIVFISYIFCLFQSYLLADDKNEAIVIMNATSKHFCNCIFISEMNIDFCYDSYQRVISTTLNDNYEASFISSFEINIDEKKQNAEVKSEFYSSVSHFDDEKGCYFKN